MSQTQFQSGDVYLTIMEVLDPLVSLKLISNQEKERLISHWVKTKDHPLSIITDVAISDARQSEKKLQPDEILKNLAEQWKVSYQRVDLLKVKLEIVGSLLPYPYADRLGIVPIEMNEDKVVIITSEPFALSWLDEVKTLLRKKIEIRIAPPKQVRHLLNEIFVIQKAFKAMAKEQGQAGSEKIRLLKQGKLGELDALVEKSKGRTLSAQDGHVAKIVDWLLNYAMLERASDIHMEPKKGLGLIRFRIDGDLRSVYRLDHEALQMVIARFKILSEMKLDEKRKPQDGGFKRTLDNGKQIEMRLSTLPTAYGEKLVIRIFDKTVAGDDLTLIGLSQEDLKIWEELIYQPQGLILVTGPTGSGKTTTLYTTLNRVATPDVNVCTAEDPIEMEIDTFNQVQINQQIGLGFGDCIRAFLRQDPDIIMVGEIRDYDTGEMAVQSSLTGHLVFSTLHTNGALATVLRLLDLGLPSYLLNSSLTGILAQRLVRKLCEECKVKTPVDKDKWEALLDGDHCPPPEFYFTPAGCEECKHTGYKGRLCVYELVKFDEKIKKHITPNIEISNLIEKTRGLFASIRVNGARKIIRGETSIDEILKVVY